MKPYTLYNPETLEILVTIFSEEQPDNSTTKMANGQLKPMYDKLNDIIYEGATPEEIAERQKLEVPFDVPLWTMRNVMRKANIFDLIIGAINQLPEPLKTDALDYLEYGNYIERHSNTVLLIQQITQFTDAQVDQLFIDADKLEL